MSPEERAAMQDWCKLHAEGYKALGHWQWRLFCGYGRVMAGPHAGLYVSGLPTNAAQHLLRDLLSGSVLPVHLMHSYQPGDETSNLRLREGRLVMVFPDREELP